MNKDIWEEVKVDEHAVDALAAKYIEFLNYGKTERKALQYILDEANKLGFKNLAQINKGELKAGDKVYWTRYNKIGGFAVIGKDGIEQGLRIVGSHLDAPRLDLKPNPLYESSNLGLLKTHYYGGIKKYQWVTIPLAIHGVIVKADGQVMEVTIGEDEKDPVFTITDLLPHLAKDQMEKKIAEAIKGEGLNILIGSKPVSDKETEEKVKVAIKNLIKDKYDIELEDFTSAELEVVPAGKAREVGLDRSMVGGYGQDDRVCVFASWEAIKKVNNNNKTAVALFVDKEETGSAGNTGMKSTFIENFVAELAFRLGEVNILTVQRALYNSKALSADVNAAVDPNYEGVLEKSNAAKINQGIVITKYTGSRGKSSTNDANAEFVGEIRTLFNRNNVVWQTGELGAVDQGGGGTIAQFMAYFGMEVIDCGIALLSMHSPFEVCGKADLYMGVKGYKEFMES